MNNDELKSGKRGLVGTATPAETRLLFPSHFEDCRRCRGYGTIPSGLDGDERGECPDCEGTGRTLKGGTP